MLINHLNLDVYVGTFYIKIDHLHVLENIFKETVISEIRVSLRDTFAQTVAEENKKKRLGKGNFS